MATARETFEQDAKDLTMLKRLENCIWVLSNVLLMGLKKA
jgi:hypothetical protein